MTNTNLNWKNKPFLLSPAGKDYLWGGERLKQDFHKCIPMTPLAETWECSTHPDGPSLVAGGEMDSLTLPEVLELHPEYLGTHPSTVLQSMGLAKKQELPGTGHAAGQELPILVKFIDAKEKLSVQVHPDDAYANSHENGCCGKTEMWYVLDAVPGAQLIYGFCRDVSRELLLDCLAKGKLPNYLQKIPVKKGDVFFIEPGTVHAIGAGVLLAEIQENSNLTYRIHDYNRLDKNGHPRPLHMEKALDVLNYRESANPRQPLRVLRYQPGCARELLGRCKYFQVERLLVNTTQLGSSDKPSEFDEVFSIFPDCTTDANSFRVLLCIEGNGELLMKKDVALEDEAAAGVPSPIYDTLPFEKGSCIFLPANSITCKLKGNAQLLQIEC